jgi:hypothetical protein
MPAAVDVRGAHGDFAARALVRARSTLATLAQAINRTIPTAARSMTLHERMLAPTR